MLDLDDFLLDLSLLLDDGSDLFSGDFDFFDSLGVVDDLLHFLDDLLALGFLGDQLGDFSLGFLLDGGGLLSADLLEGGLFLLEGDLAALDLLLEGLDLFGDLSLDGLVHSGLDDLGLLDQDLLLLLEGGSSLLDEGFSILLLDLELEGLDVDLGLSDLGIDGFDILLGGDDLDLAGLLLLGLGRDGSLEFLNLGCRSFPLQLVLGLSDLLGAGADDLGFDGDLALGVSLLVLELSDGSLSDDVLGDDLVLDFLLDGNLVLGGSNLALLLEDDLLADELLNLRLGAADGLLHLEDLLVALLDGGLLFLDGLLNLLALSLGDRGLDLVDLDGLGADWVQLEVLELVELLDAVLHAVNFTVGILHLLLDVARESVDFLAVEELLDLAESVAVDQHVLLAEVGWVVGAHFLADLLASDLEGLGALEGWVGGVVLDALDLGTDLVEEDAVLGLVESFGLAANSLSVLLSPLHALVLSELGAVALALVSVSVGIIGVGLLGAGARDIGLEALLNSVDILVLVANLLVVLGLPRDAVLDLRSDGEAGALAAEFGNFLLFSLLGVFLDLLDDLLGVLNLGRLLSDGLLDLGLLGLELLDLQLVLLDLLGDSLGFLGVGDELGLVLQNLELALLLLQLSLGEGQLLKVLLQDLLAVDDDNLLLGFLVKVSGLLLDVVELVLDFLELSLLGLELLGLNSLLGLDGLDLDSSLLDLFLEFFNLARVGFSDNLVLEFLIDLSVSLEVEVQLAELLLAGLALDFEELDVLGEGLFLLLDFLEANLVAGGGLLLTGVVDFRQRVFLDLGQVSEEQVGLLAFAKRSNSLGDWIFSDHLGSVDVGCGDLGHTSTDISRSQGDVRLVGHSDAESMHSTLLRKLVEGVSDAGSLLGWVNCSLS